VKVFVYEFSCAADLQQYPMARLLRAEGAAMLSAIIKDFAQLAEVEVLCLLAERVRQAPEGRRIAAQCANPGFSCHDGEEKKAIAELARAANFSLIIAPESQHILLERCRWVEDAGGRLLGPSSAAVELAADKLRLAKHLSRRNVPTPRTRLLLEHETFEDLHFPVVLKPRHGAGSQECYLVSNSAQLQKDHELRGLARPGSPDVLVQSYVSGRPASVSFLVSPYDSRALLPADQELSADGRFRYLGGRIPLEKELGIRATELARRAIQQLPGLLGYVGVDLVLGKPSDGSQDYVIEINPRLTTSYIGLRALTEGNLAEAILCAATGEEIPNVRWMSASVRFSADGIVELK
jgi:predicted ATP-grasp superfamily ATP-dependent carboligase